MAKIIDLSCPFDAEYSVPQWLHHNYRLEFKPLFTWTRDANRVTEFRMSTHTGTHVDAPSHTQRDGKNLDELPLSSFYGTGVVLDVQKGELGEIDADTLQKADIGVRENDVVLLYSGWGKYYVQDPRDPYWMAARRPGVAVSGAEWLVKKKVKAVGIDAPSIEHPGGPQSIRPADLQKGLITERMTKRGDPNKPANAHSTLFAHDIVLIEQMINLDRIVGMRVTVCFFPLPFTGRIADGSPVRAVAIVE